MKLSTRKIGKIVIVDIEGKVLLGDGDVEIKQAVENLLRQGDQNILLNLAKVPYIDSAGLGEVIRCYTTIRRNGGNLKLLAPNERLIDLLNITKLINVFDWYQEEEAAVASFNS